MKGIFTQNVVAYKSVTLTKATWRLAEKNI